MQFIQLIINLVLFGWAMLGVGWKGKWGLMAWYGQGVHYRQHDRQQGASGTQCMQKEIAIATRMDRQIAQNMVEMARM